MLILFLFREHHNGRGRGYAKRDEAEVATDAGNRNDK
jgi:hypothetical protein